MALFDINKSNDDRTHPSPNSHDNLSEGAVMARGTNSVNYVTPGSNLAALNGGKNGQFTIVSSGTMTNTSAVVLANSPGAGTFAKFGVVTIISQPHGLPYKPIITGSALSASGNTYLQMPFTHADYSAGATSALWNSLDFAADDTNIFVIANGMVWGSGWNLAAGWVFKYYLQYQTSN